jgi:hypothetical protein
MPVVFSPSDVNGGAAEGFERKNERGNGTACAVRFVGASLTGGGARSARHPRLLLLVRFADSRGLCLAVDELI